MPRYAGAVTETVAGLIARDPDGPLARQYLPSEAEGVDAPGEIEDPIGDKAHSPLRGLVHRYPDRVLLKLTHGHNGCLLRYVRAGDGVVFSPDQLR